MGLLLHCCCRQSQSHADQIWYAWVSSYGSDGLTHQFRCRNFLALLRCLRRECLWRILDKAWVLQLLYFNSPLPMTISALNLFTLFSSRIWTVWDLWNNDGFRSKWKRILSLSLRAFLEILGIGCWWISQRYGWSPVRVSALIYPLLPRCPKL